MSPTDRQAIGVYLASGHLATEAMIAELRELSRPADSGDQVESLVSALEAELESAQKQTRAAQTGDVEAFVPRGTMLPHRRRSSRRRQMSSAAGEGCTF